MAILSATPLRRLLRRWVLLAVTGIAGIASAQSFPDVHGLRAAMIYNLMLFVDWPAESLNDTITLCVITDDPDVSRPFAELAGKTVKSRTLMTQRRAPLASIDDCHAVFLSGLDDGLLADKLASLEGRPVLTIASSPDSGAMIDLALTGDRIVFDVSAARFRDAGLSLAARVMQLARKVSH